MTDASDQAKLEFFAKFAELFDSSTHSDLTIVVDGHSFHAIKAIVGLRTTFFTTATTGFAEAKDNTVTIHEHSVHAVWRLLKYCYTGDYPEEVNPALGKDDSRCLMHARVHALADMLDVPALKVLATSKLQVQLSKGFLMSDFCRTIREVYSTTNSPQDDAIRAVLLSTAREKLGYLKKYDPFIEVLKQFGELSSQLVILMMEERVSCAFKCNSCITERCSRHWCDECAKDVEVDFIPKSLDAVMMCTSSQTPIMHYCEACYLEE